MKVILITAILIFEAIFCNAQFIKITRVQEKQDRAFSTLYICTDYNYIKLFADTSGVMNKVAVISEENYKKVEKFVKRQKPDLDEPLATDPYQFVISEKKSEIIYRLSITNTFVFFKEFSEFIRYKISDKHDKAVLERRCDFFLKLLDELNK